MLRFVIPKGSLEARTLALLEAADLRMIRGSDRDYHGGSHDPRIDRISLLRPQEIPRYVEEAFFDLGITGDDWVQETGAKVEVVAELPYTKNFVGGTVKVVLAVSEKSSVESAGQLPDGSRISTEYPNLTRNLFEGLGKPVKIFLSYGATEAKVPEIVDAVVDVSETGGTLRRHGMKPVETLLDSSTLLIANPESFSDPEKHKAIDEIRILIKGAVEASGKALLKLNVQSDSLAAVLSLLPSLTAPTVSELAQKGFYAVETVVSTSGVNMLIPALKSAGATGILELPISKIVE